MAFEENMQRVLNASGERLPFRTPGPVPVSDLHMFKLLTPVILIFPRFS